MFSEFISMASEAVVKRTQTILPIARRDVTVTPLLTGDDVAIRSSLTSPVVYDKEMIRLLHRHTEFIEKDKPEPIKVRFEEFCSRISNIDKNYLMWGLYKATYDTITHTITCEKCKHKFKEEIPLDDIIHEDDVVIWEEADTDGVIMPFYNYVFPIQIEYNKFKYTFFSRLPSIQDNNKILGTISSDVLQQNMEKTGSLYTRPQQMALLIRKIAITNAEGVTKETENLQEILIACNNYVAHTVSEKFFKQYNEKFEKFLPKFYKMITCKNCQHEFRHNIDLEVEFFNRIILGDRSDEDVNTIEEAAEE